MVGPQLKKMDFDTAIHEIGEFGRFQQKMFFIVNFLSLPVSSQMLLMVFVAAKQEWRCESDMTSKCNQDGVICKNAFYTSNYTSIVSEWDLVCDQAYKIEVVQSMFMVGNLFGGLFIGHLADSHGRKKTWMYSYIGTCIFIVLSAISTSYNMLVSMRFVLGVFVGGCGLVSYVISTESVGVGYRGLIGTTQMLFFSLFLLILGWLAYMIPNWRYLTIVTMLPGLIQLPLFHSIPESPRWLASKGKYLEAEAILNQAARMNKPHQTFKIVLKHSEHVKTKDTNNPGVWGIFTHRATCIVTFIICLLFFVNSLVYYGLALNVKNLGGDLYVNFVLNGLVEFPSVLLTVCLISSLGRRKSLFFFMMGASLSCFICMRLQEYHSSSVHLISGAALSGKFFINASFGLIYVYGSELLPTVIRNTGLGIASVANRLGGILTPFVVLLGEHSRSLPMLMFALCSLVVGIIGLSLKETKGQPLPETFDDVGKSVELSEKVRKVRS